MTEVNAATIARALGERDEVLGVLAQNVVNDVADLMNYSGRPFDYAIDEALRGRAMSLADRLVKVVALMKLEKQTEARGVLKNRGITIGPEALVFT